MYLFFYSSQVHFSTREEVDGLALEPMTQVAFSCARTSGSSEIDRATARHQKVPSGRELSVQPGLPQPLS